jgi:hypothetical protein
MMLAQRHLELILLEPFDWEVKEDFGIKMTMGKGISHVKVDQRL